MKIKKTKFASLSLPRLDAKRHRDVQISHSEVQKNKQKNRANKKNEIRVTFLTQTGCKTSL